MQIYMFGLEGLFFRLLGIGTYLSAKRSICARDAYLSGLTT